MVSALIYLRVTSLKNWCCARLKSLRRPKQLAGAVMFALYFWFFFLRHWATEIPNPEAARLAPSQVLDAVGTSAALAIDWMPPALAIGTLVLLLVGALMWVIPTNRAGLHFSEAEIAFLFPAPIARTALIHFRLLSAQFRSLAGALLMMLISNRWTFLGGSPLTHALGWWFVFSALSLHHSGAGFTLTRLGDAGLRVGLRRALVVGGGVALIALTWWRLPTAARFPVSADLPGAQAFALWIVSFTETAPLSWVLIPLRVILAPFFAEDAGSFLTTLGPALIILVAHYFWVVKTAAAFEDASIQNAQRRSAHVAAWRAGQARFGGAPTAARKDPFPLARRGPVELAFLWKNLLSAWPYFTVRTFALSAFTISAGCWWLHSQPAWRPFLVVVSTAAASVGAYLLVLGPQFARQDLRSDLAHADILKAYPLPGWRIVLGELLTPVAILTGVVWLMLLALTATLPGTTALGDFPLTARIACAGWMAAITPILVTLQMLVPNAAALVFPEWFQTSRGQGGGPEVAGQRMIFFFAQIVTMAIAILPPAALGGSLFFISLEGLDLTVAVSVTVAAIPLLGVLILEVACGIWLLGRRFEKLDLSAELRS